ncbi:MAG: hypothetical protein J6W75_09975 [Bacteroidaceae bacterium]|nr:hypothetical protein [Bacteroidaceae bacterium]
MSSQTSNELNPDMLSIGLIILQVFTMWQPKAILETDGGTAHLKTVELKTTETLVTFEASSSSSVFPILSTAYASDEADIHHPLLRHEEKGTTITLVFEALPQTTRLFDIVADSSHRWMGIHSSIHTLQLPHARPRFDAEATLPDSIEQILQDNALADWFNTGSPNTAIRRQLSLFQDYVVWKWHLSPHAAFLLQRSHEQATMPITETPSHETTLHTETRQLPPLPMAPRPKTPLLRRLFKRKEKPTAPAEKTSKRTRPLSRFEQKMLQEKRKQ